MVVRHNGADLDTSRNEEVDKHALHLGLPALEIVPADEDPARLGELDDPRNKCVLGGAVDVTAALEDGGNSKDCRGRYLVFPPLYRRQQILRAVIQSRLKITGPAGKKRCVGRRGEAAVRIVASLLGTDRTDRELREKERTESQ